jgi:ABC-2 type transport system ATP-binding protein
MELQIRDLAKTYGNGVRALDRVSLTIPTGMFSAAARSRSRSSR